MAARSAGYPAGTAHTAHSALQSPVQRLVQKTERGWQHGQPVTWYPAGAAHTAHSQLSNLLYEI